MRWRRLTDHEKWARREERAKNWRRKFALWPAEDCESHMTYWFEYIWIRRKSRDKDGRSPYVYEVRGGRDCPEIKTRPPSPLPDAAVAVAVEKFVEHY